MGSEACVIRSAAQLSSDELMWRHLHSLPHEHAANKEERLSLAAGKCDHLKRCNLFWGPFSACNLKFLSFFFKWANLKNGGLHIKSSSDNAKQQLLSTFEKNQWPCKTSLNSSTTMTLAACSRQGMGCPQGSGSHHVPRMRLSAPLLSLYLLAYKIHDSGTHGSHITSYLTTIYRLQRLQHLTHQ